MFEFRFEDADKHLNINGSVYVSKSAREHVGYWFETVLVFHGFTILPTNDLQITAILNGGVKRVIDPTCNGLSCNDESLDDVIKLIKSLLCLSHISHYFAADEYQKRGYQMLNIAYKYLQIKQRDAKVISKYDTPIAVVNALEKDFNLESLPRPLGIKYDFDVSLEKLMQFKVFSYQPTRSKHLDFIQNMLNRSLQKKMIDRFLPKDLTNFQKERFEILLEGSLSLDYREKLRVIQSLPVLNYFQITELMKTFEEELDKFAGLKIEHPEDLERLERRRQQIWSDLQKTEYFEER